MGSTVKECATTYNNMTETVDEAQHEEKIEIKIFVLVWITNGKCSIDELDKICSKYS